MGTEAEAIQSSPRFFLVSQKQGLSLPERRHPNSRSTFVIEIVWPVITDRHALQGVLLRFELFYRADSSARTRGRRWRGDSGFCGSDAALHNINLVALVSLTIFHSVDLDGEAPNTDPASRAHKKYHTVPGRMSSGFQRRGPIHWSRHKLRLD
jgi:hypothetical protein